MVLKVPRGQQRMFWAFEKGIFQFFCKFLSNKGETVFWESETETWRPIKFKVGHRKLFTKGFEVTLRSKTNVLSVWQRKFSGFCKFWVSKLKPSCGKVMQNIKNCLNQNLVIWTFLENGFDASLSSRTNIVGVWKWHFLVFCKI